VIIPIKKIPMKAIYFDMHLIKIRKKLCLRENRLGVWLGI
jgi:hypothetical protein